MGSKLTALVTCGLMAMSTVAITTPAKAQLGIIGAIADQVAYGGRNYCFYPNGWRGPGWYWCGYAFRRGLGWGGPEGWHGFRRGGGRFHGGGFHGGGFHGGGGHMGGGGFHGGGGHMGGGHTGGGHMGGGHGGGGHGGHH